MQKMRFITISKLINLSRHKKLKAENLSYFDFNYESERNKFIVNFERYIYYRDIFILIDYFKDLIKIYNKSEIRFMII